jgi:hypothetical protein
MSYDNIKDSLTDLYNAYVPQQVETFVVDMFPAFPSAEVDSQYVANLPSMLNEISQQAARNGIPRDYFMAMTSIAKEFRPSEVYLVLVNFDLHPAKLDLANKTLRIKYLNLLKKAVELSDQYLSPMAKAKMIEGMNEPRRMVARMPDGRMEEKLFPPEPPSPIAVFILKNFDSGRNMLIRLIDLLILEASPVVCGECWAKSKVDALAKIQTTNWAGFEYSKNGRCGPDFGNTACSGNACCSQFGWCGGKKGKNDDWCGKYKGFDGRFDHHKP